MLKKPNPVWYFTAVMYNAHYINEPDAVVKELFGEIVLKSGEFSFDHTKYYEPEMGPGLRKYFAAFGSPCEPAFLPEYKHMAIKTEEKYCVDGKRAINVDPGYLAVEKIVVASTKNFTHRIYLSDGIFGDLQLMRQKGGYKPMPWTYADYMRQESTEFFNALAKLLDM